MRRQSDTASSDEGRQIVNAKSAMIHAAGFPERRAVFKKAHEARTRILADKQLTPKSNHGNHSETSCTTMVSAKGATRSCISSLGECGRSSIHLSKRKGSVTGCSSKGDAPSDMLTAAATTVASTNAHDTSADRRMQSCALRLRRR